LFPQLIRRAASRADCTAGNNNPTITPMIAITTNNSTNVKACLDERASAAACFLSLASNIIDVPR
jgi:hypothetical protein